MSEFRTWLAAFAPGVAAGLFVGRLVAELWATWNGSTELWLAVLFTLAGILLCTRVLRRLPFSETWPALLLLIYVFYPERNLAVAGSAVALSFLAWWQTSQSRPHLASAAINFALPLSISLLFFALYVTTLSPDILPADNGEFQLVATTLGVAHPPGFPLYTMLAHLLTRLPLGPTPAFRASLFSAVTSTVTLTAVYASLFLLTRRHLAAIGATLALATATTFWAQATTANIRSMTALLAALLFLVLILFYRQASSGDMGQPEVADDRYLILAALILGLGVSHHASLAFLGLIAVTFVLAVDTTLWRTPARWWRPFLAFLLGLLPLLYLPLRANAAVRGASPELATWSGFVEHALATGFRGDLFVYLEPVLLAERLEVMLNVLTFQFSPWLILAMLIGLILLLRRDWRLALLFGGSALIFTFITATYRAPQTVEYMLPAYVALALLLGVAAGGVGSERRPTGLWRSSRALLTGLIIVLGLNQLSARFESYSWLSDDYSVRDYANSSLLVSPPDSLLLANWHWATPLWYLQEVEGQRQDVEVRYVFPEGESYAETWARRVNEGLTDGRTVITTNYDPDSFTSLSVPEPLGEAFMFSNRPRTMLPEGYKELDVILGERLHLLGYKLEQESTTVGSNLELILAWQPVGELHPAAALFAHMVDSGGKLHAQDDVPAQARKEGITLTGLTLAPFAGTQPGEYSLLVGAYDEETLATPGGETRLPMTTVVVEPTSFAPATGNRLHRDLLIEQAASVVGYDWDNTLPEQPRLYVHYQTPSGYTSEVHDGTTPAMPTYAGPWGVVASRWSGLKAPESGLYVPLGEGIVWIGDQVQQESALDPGQDLVFEQHFLSGRPVFDDLAVSVRLIGYEDDGFHWAWWDLDDSIPAMGAIPTLKWIAGSAVSSPHFLTVSVDAAPGQKVGGALTLYDAFTSRSLPLLDERLATQYGWIPLGEASVSP